MRKYLLLNLILFLFFHQSNAQLNAIPPESLSGIVVYQQKMNMRDYVVKLDTLKFNRTKSIFSWNLFNDNVSIPGKIKQKFPTTEFPEFTSSMNGQINFFDVSKDTMYSRKNMRHLNAVLYLKEKTPFINWIVADSTKKVGNYTVQKATARFRGRDYTAWFAPEIPLPYGPWKLHGLPGLILETYDKSGNVYFSATDIAFTDVGPIGPIALDGEEQVITLDEYKEIMNNFDKTIKAKALKIARRFFSSEEMADVKIDLPDVELMEIFADGTDH